MQDYRFRGNGISLALFPMRKTASTVLGIASGSEVVIASDCTCTAAMSDGDLNATRQIIGASAEAAELQDRHAARSDTR